MKWGSMNELCDIVRETSFAIHKYHRNGHLEKIYERALVHRLKKQGLQVEQQYPLAVYDEDGTELGQFFADVFVEDCLILEVKAISRLTNEHVAQLLGYLKTCRRETGLLINFGASKLQIKKYLYSQGLSEGSCGQENRL
ncbi:MAG: GxxExxY protein [Planctomycetota bacterium]|nr:GxxExxY protein [Planctomycetota bacterium]